MSLLIFREYLKLYAKHMAKERKQVISERKSARLVPVANRPNMRGSRQPTVGNPRVCRTVFSVLGQLRPHGHVTPKGVWPRHDVIRHTKQRSRGAPMQYIQGRPAVIFDNQVTLCVRIRPYIGVEWLVPAKRHGRFTAMSTCIHGIEFVSAKPPRAARLATWFFMPGVCRKRVAYAGLPLLDSIRDTAKRTHVRSQHEGRDLSRNPGLIRSHLYSGGTACAQARQVVFHVLLVTGLKHLSRKADRRVPGFAITRACRQ